MNDEFTPDISTSITNYQIILKTNYPLTMDNYNNKLLLLCVLN